MFITAVGSQLAAPSPQQQWFEGNIYVYITFRSQSSMCPSVPLPLILKEWGRVVQELTEHAVGLCRSWATWNLGNFDLTRGPRENYFTFFTCSREKYASVLREMLSLFSMDTTRHVETPWKLASSRNYLAPVRHTNSRLLPSQGLLNGNLWGEFNKPSGDSVRSMTVHQPSFVSD